MECIKLGFKPGFLLCLKFGHITDDLAHVAASVDDLWSLQILNTMEVPLNKKDSKNMTPLEVAVGCYSY
jgi:hypothetical protein